MTYEQAWQDYCTRIAARDYVGAYATIRAYRLSAPTSRDFGCALRLEAHHIARTGADELHPWSLLEDARLLLKGHPSDYAELCMAAVAAASQMAEVERAKVWMTRYVQTLAEHRSTRSFLPHILGCYAKVLWGACRYHSARAVLIRACEELRSLPPTDRNVVALRQMSLMGAWCSLRCNEPVMANEWLGRVIGDPHSGCWADIRRAVTAELLTMQGKPAAARAELLACDPSQDDIGAMYVAIAGVTVAKAFGEDWRLVVHRALLNAVQARHYWALRPLREMLQTSQGKGLARVAFG